jgi:hypothetical protein
VRALKPIYAGSKLLISTSIPKRYRVVNGGVLDYFEDSLSHNMSRKSSALPKTIKRERKRKRSDSRVAVV